MSDAIFPAYQGISWPLVLTPQHATKVLKAVSLKEQRALYSAYPVYSIGITYEFLRKSEFIAVMGFFNLRHGNFDSFLFTNKDDSSVSDQLIGVANGTATQFQLVRTFGGFTEPVCNLDGAATIQVDGVTKTLGTHYTVSSSGLVNFVTAPTAGAVITFTGSYFWRVRFKDDHTSFNKTMANLWDNKKLELVGCTGNKVK